ncbi:sulfite exporter TauE/SafE family protein [Marinobacterium jannaschii]|uniref:sulfite exporter TauE/SafE family protein n=1 Tax=Marinobacterium jannaschii TaxID=64970 RepID=UPI000687D853|nr:sulfite exporter TauE/SafE family protein [Marinobacterium jannaschii]
MTDLFTMPDLPLWQLVLAAVIVFAAAIMRGFSGFGFSALTVTSLALFMPPKLIVPVIFLLEIAASAHLLPGVLRQIDRKLLLHLSIGMMLFTPGGVWLLAHLDADYTRLVISGLVLLIALVLLAGIQQKENSPSLPFVTGCVSGAVNGAAAIGGLPVVLMMLYSGMSAIATRATLVAYFVVTDIYAMAWMGHQDLLTAEVVSLSLLVLLPMTAGIGLGSWLFRRSGQGGFRTLALVLLLLVSGIGLVRAGMAVMAG